MSSSHWRILPIILLIAGILATSVQSANILFLSGSLSHASHIFNRVIATSLAHSGHNVTMLTPERDSVPGANGRLHFIHLEGVYEQIYERYPSARENHLHNRQPVFRRIKESHRVSNGISGEMSRTVGIQRLLNYPSTFQFDAIIHDATGAQSLLGFWSYFNRPPLISISPTNLPVHLHSIADVPFYAGVMQHPFADYSPRLVLATRVYNMLYFLYDTIYRSFPFMRAENMIARRLFGDHLEDLNEIQRNAKLFLVNTHPVIDPGFQLPPNVIPVAGVQLERGTPIPPSIQMFLDASKNGVVVLSLGTGLFTPTLTREEDEVFLEVFKSLYQYDFLWRYEKTEKLECPRNVMMLDWLPNQHLILQHPKVRLLITNGGQLSIQEAIHAAVPVVGIPMRFDQRQKLMKLQAQGVAQLLPLRRLRNDTLTSTIMKALDENLSPFQGNVLRMSQLWRSQPDPAGCPVKRAVRWIEYVMVHSDLEHLQSPVANVPFRVVYSLDMLLAFAFTVIGFWAIFFKHLIWDKMRAKAEGAQSKPDPQPAETDGPSAPTAGLAAITEQGEDTEKEDHDDEEEERANVAEDGTNVNDVAENKKEN